MRHRYRSRAFTLVELMIVVAIVGVLAALAIVGFRKYLKASKTSEPIYVTQGIRSAQESYRSETMTYLDVTQNGTYYPTGNSPNHTKWGWGGGNDATSNNWRTLSVVTDGPVRFGYKANAGVAGIPVNVALDPQFVFPSIGGSPPGPPQWPAPPVEPWYIIQAKGDPEDTGTPTLMLGNSFQGELYWENE
jgi:type IV pilus assembly protein PilA